MHKNNDDGRGGMRHGTSHALLAMTFVLVSAAGAVGCDGGGGETCNGQVVDAPFEAQEVDQEMPVTCMIFGGVGQPLNAHREEVRFEDGTILELRFSIDVKAPATLTLTGEETQASARVFNSQGFEGGPKYLCDLTTPESSAVAGELSLTSLTVGAGGFLEEMHGSVEASFTGCTIESLGITDAPLTLQGEL